MPAIYTSPTPLSVGDIAIRVKRIFGDESGTQIDDADILRWANDAQLDIARKTRCLIKTEYYNTANGTHELNPPPGFLFFLRAICDGRLLSAIPYQELDVRNPNRGMSYPSGTPEYISFIGQSVLLYPAPSVTGNNNLAITYIARPATLDSTGDVLEIPDQYYESVVRFCLMRAKELDQDWAAAQLFQKQYEDELNEIRDDAANASQAAYPVVRDDEGDSW